jgi:hypothetical protein
MTIGTLGASVPAGWPVVILLGAGGAFVAVDWMARLRDRRRVRDERQIERALIRAGIFDDAEGRN